MRFYILLFLFFNILSIQARENSAITGKVNDDKHSPVPFANIVLLNSSDSSIVKSALSDESGNFKFENISGGNYKILVAQLGYEKHYSESFQLNPEDAEKTLSEINLNPTAVNLREANVSALKPFIEHKIDRTIINVENSIINAGTNVIEILQHSPGVTVDNEGNITLSGKQGVLVMIDNKPTYLTQKDLYELLRNTSSDQLSYVEVITNPSAKYDAAGTSGIINIRMKRKQNMGWNGQLHSSYGQGKYPDFGIGFNLNYGNEKLNFFSGYDFVDGFYFEEITMKRQFNDEHGVSNFHQYTYDKGNFKNNNFRAGADYQINKKHSAGFIIKGSYNFNDDNTTSNTDIYNQSATPDSGYVTLNMNDSKWTNYSGNLNYMFRIDTAGQELTVDADFAHYDNANNFKFETNHYFTGSDYTYTEYSSSDQPAEIDIRTIKTDYTLPLGQQKKLEAGAKSSYVTTDNDVRYYNYYHTVQILDTGKSNHFRYTENINAAYINLSGEFGKFGLQSGLRAEQTIANGEQYINNTSFDHNYIEFFPSLFLSYKLSDKHQVNWSYSRRIDRPAYQQLNPFKYFIDPYNYMEGNPFLGPQLTNSFEVTYLFKQLYSITFNFSHTQDAMTQITKQIDSIRTTFVTTENLDSYDNYGVNISIPFSIGERIQSTNNFNLFHNSYAGVSSVGFVDNSLLSYTFNSNNRFTLFKGITAELNFWYNSKSIWGTWLVKPFYSLSGGLSKFFFNEKVQLRINLNDILHTDLINSKIEYQNINVDFKRVYDSQFVRFHLTYKFGKQVQRRMRKAGSEDEQNRIKQGH